jgi:general stress protein 26
MSLLIKSSLTCLLLLFVIPMESMCQDQKSLYSTEMKLIQAAREIMSSAETCALISVDATGSPRVRTMDPFMPDSSLTVWFGTNPHSRKVAQIKKDPRVTLYYLDKDASGYVTIHGKAQIVDEQTEKDKRWKKEWEAFYPDKVESYTLIKVSPVWMEIVSPPRGLLGDDTSWTPPVVRFEH